MGLFGELYGGGVGGGGGDTVVGSQVPYFRKAGTQQHGTGAVTVPWPDHEVADVALLLVENQDATGVTFTDAAGFTAIANSPQETHLASRLSVYWCRASTNAQPSPIIADPGDHVIAQIITFRGVKSSGNPYNATAGSAIGSGSSSAMTLPTVTTTVDNCLIVGVGSTNADGGSLAWASGWANANILDIHEITDIRTDDGGGGGIAASCGPFEVAGATGTITFTSTGNTQGGGLTIALLPEPPVVIPDVDVTPPQITMISPMLGSALTRFEPITFRLTDDTLLHFVVAWIKYKSDRYKLMMYDGDGFSWPFDDESTVIATGDNQLDFSILPVGGWRDDIELIRIRFLDSGNLDIE